ncbi:hypothetical protein SJAG_01220 [Schizosaccharomyces japonicus yFS275]|uniref:MEMO1 family protein n=1 Tax=Schizosaccharomyces japonicus (strain yFS275 / FY16936) TaxID=402676 RepID=B6K031_SCHJY|nr:hypothetical protein SJAG_01220 [Schizosaccharomyces japonicus yFS275]EEB06181.1 hypothetical protein SJAG_01220 [Schizosaccharomyces japonicus yFS275]
MVNHSTNVRPLTHAGTWYTDDFSALKKQLDGFMAGTQIVPGTRMIISPHAGYLYSGPTAGKCYGSLDFSHCKRVFVLGPSHHMYTRDCLVSSFDAYATHLGNLPIDREVCDFLLSSSKHVQLLSENADEAEHSLEMQIPILAQALQNQNALQHVSIVPIMVGALSHSHEQAFGETLAPFVANEENVFIISSDFCHWGLRFGYTGYLNNDGKFEMLAASSHSPRAPKIFQSVHQLDRLVMSAIEEGDYNHFVRILSKTKNTVCGQHPIAVILAALTKANIDKRFRFIAYDQSSQVVDIEDSSVSYAAGLA